MTNDIYIEEGKKHQTRDRIDNNDRDLVKEDT